MAPKAKTRPKVTKKAPKRPAVAGKSIHLKAKPAVASLNGQRAAGTASKRIERAASRRTSPAPALRSAPPARSRSAHFASAVQAYEAGIKLMHAEEFEKAIR